jgi:flagellum-specific peptidoglycan hydrolase FlgJ
MKHLFAALAICVTTTTQYSEFLPSTLVEKLEPIENTTTNSPKKRSSTNTNKARTTSALTKIREDTGKKEPKIDSSQICILSHTPTLEKAPSFLLEGLQAVTKEELLPDFSIIRIDHARKYIEEIYPFAVKVHKEHRIPVPIVLAIACLESGYGRSHNAQNKFNQMGIRTYKGGKAGYRRFPSTEACFEYFGNLLEKKRYSPLKEIKDDNLLTWITVLCKSGYNHRERYIIKVMQMVRFIHLDQLKPNIV